MASLNSRDSFPGRKFKNRARTSCSRGPVLSPPTITFELHAKVAEEIDVEMCSYGQLSEVQMLRDLDLDLTSGRGHTGAHIGRGLPTHQIRWKSEKKLKQQYVLQMSPQYGELRPTSG